MLSETVGQRCVMDFIRRVGEADGLLWASDVKNLADETGVDASHIEKLLEHGVLHTTGGRHYLSKRGRAVALMVQAVNGEVDFGAVPVHLAELYPSARPYELIEGQVTQHFIDMLRDRSGFTRMCICSPWIRLDRDARESIRSAVKKAWGLCGPVRVHVVTLPLSDYRDAGATSVMRFLFDLGAEIAVRPRLHAKLYISEPGPNGGFNYAIFGSENLTGRNNVELAIRIDNDSYLVRRLTGFFDTVFAEGRQLKEEDL